ncbi:hypothetical protein LAV_00143 [Sphingobium phage Lacusarx]|uniref:Uncharacterized protein n=1 Tax=Sphingobium phage Lacusarx TaxID=1980139 RepID=A0A1W6DX75_9CAUD|nr:hypothetical protein FDH44_gp160 [Sphingobium phage Lacusarx]ARK07518.1 hypothetical protein LAV_00143 [Sphingobium phage Lacusarx]
MTPPNTIGFGAVVIPSLDEFQGFYLIDDKALHQSAVMAQMAAVILGGPGGAIGALQATIVEGYIQKRQDLIAANALALHGITKKPYFWIKATIESEGTRTEMFELKATTPDEARIEVNHLPEVLEIKKRLRVEMMKPKSSRN